MYATPRPSPDLTHIPGSRLFVSTSLLGLLVVVGSILTVPAGFAVFAGLLGLVSLPVVLALGVIHIGTVVSRLVDERGKRIRSTIQPGDEHTPVEGTDVATSTIRPFETD